MSFTSYGFIAFLAVLFLAYYCVPRKWQWGLLLAGSYVFYAFAGLDCLVLIALTTLVAYLIARLIAKNARREADYLAAHRAELEKEARKAYKAREKKKRFRVLTAGLLLCFGILALLKYTAFAVENLNDLFGLFRLEPLSVPSLVLPLGISLYIFQTCGYLIDVYRGKTEAERNPLRLALFVGFFPQLVQGPISRHSDLAGELFAPHAFDRKNVTLGLWRILWGYFKKLVIADRVMVAMKTMLAEPADYDGVYVVLLILLYSAQIYADFTGGIDMTIGIAQALGIRLKENFDHPFSSGSTKEYWRRWHITMGTWFTDYIFYPISVCKPMMKLSKWGRAHLGNAIGKRLPVYLATVATWYLTGLWHGAGWNFIVWGLLNCLVILVSQELEPLYSRFRGKFPRLTASRGYGKFMAVRTFLLMGLIRSLDCYRDVPTTFRQWGTILTTPNWGELPRGLFSLGLDGADWIILLLALLIVAVVSKLSMTRSVRERLYDRPFLSCFLVGGLFVAVILFGAYGIGYDAGDFIYRQF